MENFPYCAERVQEAAPRVSVSRVAAGRVRWTDLAIGLALGFLILGQDGFPQAPIIANVTNAALPALGVPPRSAILAPRSIATIFGTNLADSTVLTTPPWKRTLGGTEVHLAEDSCFDSSCEFVADLLYVSPTQINFVVPEVDGRLLVERGNTAELWRARVVLVRGGVRFDDRSSILGGPGSITIDALYTTTLVSFLESATSAFSPSA